MEREAPKAYLQSLENINHDLRKLWSSIDSFNHFVYGAEGPPQDPMLWAEQLLRDTRRAYEIADRQPHPDLDRFDEGIPELRDRLNKLWVEASLQKADAAVWRELHEDLLQLTEVVKWLPWVRLELVPAIAGDEDLD